MKLGVIGGSGLAGLQGLTDCAERIVSTRCGMPSSSLHSGRLGNCEVVFLARHGRPHSIAPHQVNYRANLLALQSAGVEAIVAVNAVGGISPVFATGMICLPLQIIDYTHGREHTFSDGSQPLQHIDFSQPYSEPLRQRLLQAAHQAGEALHDGGVHGVSQGPRLETAAEIRRMQQDGCDIVGMTGMPEAALARELGMDYACLAVVANPAAGLATVPITLADIEQVMQAAGQRLNRILAAFCNRQ